MKPEIELDRIIVFGNITYPQFLETIKVLRMFYSKDLCEEVFTKYLPLFYSEATATDK